MLIIQDSNKNEEEFNVEELFAQKDEVENSFILPPAERSED